MVSFPNSDKYVLSLQLQRAAIFIPANVAEGSGRGSNKDFLRFPDFAIASAFEPKPEIILSYDLSFISEQNLNTILPGIQEDALYI